MLPTAAFSWEHNEGMTKPAEKAQAPTTHHRLSLPPPPGWPSTRGTSYAVRPEDDPFLAAFLICTKSTSDREGSCDTGKRRSTGAQEGQRRFPWAGLGLGALSCKRDDGAVGKFTSSCKSVSDQPATPAPVHDQQPSSWDHAAMLQNAPSYDAACPQYGGHCIMDSGATSHVTGNQDTLAISHAYDEVCHEFHQKMKKWYDAVDARDERIQVAHKTWYMAQINGTPMPPYVDPPPKPQMPVLPSKAEFLAHLATGTPRSSHSQAHFCRATALPLESRETTSLHQGGPGKVSEDDQWVQEMLTGRAGEVASGSD